VLEGRHTRRPTNLHRSRTVVRSASSRSGVIPERWPRQVRPAHLWNADRRAYAQADVPPVRRLEGSMVRDPRRPSSARYASCRWL